jgi:hypothetical protein
MSTYYDRKQIVGIATERGYNYDLLGKTKLIVYGQGNSYTELHWPTKGGFLQEGPAIEYAGMAFADTDLIKRATGRILYESEDK